MPQHIHQHKDWNEFTWQNAAVSASLGEVRLLQGKVLGCILSLGFSSKEEKNLDMLTADILNSSEIEGEKLDREQVRSSVARRLGVDTAGAPAPRNVDGIVEITLGDYLAENPGSCSLFIHIPVFGGEKTVRIFSGINISGNINVINELKNHKCVAEVWRR